MSNKTLLHEILLTSTRLKPLLPFAATFLLPRAYSYFRALQTSVRTSPPPRTLPPKTSTGLNILFCSTILFLICTIWDPFSSRENVFQSTQTRLLASTDVIFTRLAMLRPAGNLTPGDLFLKDKFKTKAYVFRPRSIHAQDSNLFPRMRQLYLRFGPSTVMSCQFCNIDDPTTYLLYYLPVTLLLPHLLSILSIGLATSIPISGHSASRYRILVLVFSFILLAIDIYVAAFEEPGIDQNMPSPNGIYFTLLPLRYLVLCFVQAVAALIIWASSTNRLPLLVTPYANDPHAISHRRAHTLQNTTMVLQMAQTKLHALSVTRNAVVRDTELKEADDRYWGSIVAVEGNDAVGRIWEDEDVREAMQKTLADGKFDMNKSAKESEAFVGHVTQNLEE